jgi:hypothetical protein
LPLNLPSPHLDFALPHAKLLDGLFLTLDWPQGEERFLPQSYATCEERSKPTMKIVQN